MLIAGGCAISPTTSSQNHPSLAPERDLLAQAAAEIENAPWPMPERASFFERMTGGDGDGAMTRSDAASVYINSLDPANARGDRVIADATANLSAAERFNLIALHAMSAPRLSMNDVVAVEGAIQTLREHRLIFTAAVKQLADSGEAVDDARVDMVREAYAHAIKSLGETADHLADRIERDRSTTYARPDRIRVNNFSDL